MPLQLRDRLHWCDCGGSAVFLDLDADRYFRLPAEANDAFLRLAACETGAGDANRLQGLIHRGLLVEKQLPAPFRPAAVIDAPAGDYLVGPFPRAQPIALLRAFAFELRAAWLLRTKPLVRVVEAAAKESRNSKKGTHSKRRALEGIVAASSAAAFVTRSHNRCLVRGLAVHALCKREGIKAKLVFGVIAHPFAAHCWVQLGSAVLVGGFEQARLYTPILVVG
jgi:hypothetical protein